MPSHHLGLMVFIFLHSWFITLLTKFHIVAPRSLYNSSVDFQAISLTPGSQGVKSSKSITLCTDTVQVLSSEFGRRHRVRSRARRWLQLVGCAALLLDASNFGGPDGVGESGVELRRSLRRRERVKEK